jgi:hypothetical protein
MGAPKLAPVTSITPTSSPILLSPVELCERVPGLTVAALKEQRKRGDGPPYMKANARAVVYDWNDYLEWLSSTKRTSTDRFGERS